MRVQPKPSSSRPTVCRVAGVHSAEVSMVASYVSSMAGVAANTSIRFTCLPPFR